MTGRDEEMWTGSAEKSALARDCEVLLTLGITETNLSNSDQNFRMMSNRSLELFIRLQMRIDPSLRELG
jgi:hypothetical protein